VEVEGFNYEVNFYPPGTFVLCPPFAEPVTVQVNKGVKVKAFSLIRLNWLNFILEAPGE